MAGESAAVFKPPPPKPCPLRTEPQPRSTSLFTFDAQNRLLTGGGATYDYDGDGRRVRKTKGPDQTFFLYDAAGSLAAEYTLGTPPASPCTTCYLTADHLGSTRLITDPAATPISRLDYAPFGEELLVPTGSPRFGIAGYGADAKVTEKFTGKERDTETGLDYFGARYMSSAQGRFVSVDPIFMRSNRLLDPQRLNLFTYVRNNPTKYVDPDGADVTVNVTASVQGTSYVYNRPRGGLPREVVSTYLVFVMNDSGSIETFEATRDTNFNGVSSKTRGIYGSESEAPPGFYAGGLADVGGVLGSVLRVADPSSRDFTSIRAPDGTLRTGIMIHVGPGCSEGCMLLTGGRTNRDRFIETIRRMLAQDRENGQGTKIHVSIADRNTSYQRYDGSNVLRKETLDEIEQRERTERERERKEKK